MRKKDPQLAASPTSAVIYARFSSHNQKDESIEQQVEECTEYAEKNGLKVTKIYADAAISGRTEARTQFQRLKADAKRGKFAIIIAYKSSRIARNMMNALSFEADMQLLGIKVCYAKEEFGDNAAGRFALRTMMNVNQFYAENLSEDTRRGMLDNARKCKVNGPLPYGYAASKKGFYDINPDEADVVREIFNKTARGVPFVDIALDLNSRHIKTRLGREWTSHSFATILKNERYIGTYIYDDIKIENGIPAIIDRGLFLEVNEKLKTKKNPQGRHRENGDYLLSGKLYCGECGKPMMGMSGTSKTGNLHFYYTCMGKRLKTKKCHKKNVRRDEIEYIIAEAVQRYILKDEVIEWVANTVIEFQNNNGGREEIKNLQRELSEVKKKIDNFMVVIEKGLFSDTAKERLESLEEERISLEGQIAMCRSELPAVTKDEIITWMYSFSGENIRDKKIQKSLFDAFVKKVYLFEDGRAKILFDLYENADATGDSWVIECGGESSFSGNNGSPQLNPANA